MWISRQVRSANFTPAVETGRVTANRNGEVEAVGSGVERSVSIFAPYGYSYTLPAGESVLMAESGGTAVGMGVKMKQSPNSGEIIISNPFGAYIHLKKDGSVVINGLVINSDGEVINDD